MPIPTSSLQQYKIGISKGFGPPYSVVISPSYGRIFSDFRTQNFDKKCISFFFLATNYRPTTFLFNPNRAFSSFTVIRILFFFTFLDPHTPLSYMTVTFWRFIYRSHTAVCPTHSLNFLSSHFSPYVALSLFFVLPFSPFGLFIGNNSVMFILSYYLNDAAVRSLKTFYGLNKLEAFLYKAKLKA